MSIYIHHLLLALAWVAITGTFSLANLLFGLILATASLFVIRETVGSLGYMSRAWRIFALASMFVTELILSASRVAKLVFSPKMDILPGIIAYPLTVKRDFEITLLANLITLTPGTLSVDVSDDRETLFIHTLNCADPEQLRRELQEGFERRIIEAFQ